VLSVSGVSQEQDPFPFGSRVADACYLNTPYLDTPALAEHLMYVVPSLGVQRTSLRTVLGNRALRLLAPAYFLSSVILDWKDEEGIWLAVTLLLGLASLLDFVWPEARTSPKPVNISKLAMCLVALALFAGGGWRHFARK
jgi:hypothetical protein